MWGERPVLESEGMGERGRYGASDGCREAYMGKVTGVGR